MLLYMTNVALMFNTLVNGINFFSNKNDTKYKKKIREKGNSTTMKC